MVLNLLRLLACRFRQVVDVFLVISLMLLLSIQTAYGLDASNVMVLYNSESADGLQIAQYYTQLHPGVRLLAIEDVEVAEEVSQEDYLKVIRPQVLAALSDEIKVIVTTRGMPLRIHNEVENPGTYDGWRGEDYNVPIFNDWWKTYSSLESELTRVTLINSAEMMGDQASFLSPPSFPYQTLHHAANPYYCADQAFDSSTPGYDGMRLTSRLDGFTVDDVLASLDRAQNACIISDQHAVIVDDDPDVPATNSDMMPELALEVLPFYDQDVIYDSTEMDIFDADEPVIGYVGHGSHAAGSRYISKFEFELADGAIFQTWESFNAYSFVEGNNLHGQALIGEWLQAGGTAALGHVEEPGGIGTRSVAREDIFWNMLLQGYTFAEAAWAATPQLSYVNTVVGDPLMQLKYYCVGDLNRDGIVGLDDLHLVLINWNTWVVDGYDQGDVNSNGFIGLDDLDLILAYWTSSTEPPQMVIPEPGTLLFTTVICSIAMMRRH